MGGSLASHQGMPQPTEMTPQQMLARTFSEETFSREEMSSIVDTLAPKLNATQAKLCEEIYQAVN